MEKNGATSVERNCSVAEAETTAPCIDDRHGQECKQQYECDGGRKNAVQPFGRVCVVGQSRFNESSKYQPLFRGKEEQNRCADVGAAVETEVKGTKHGRQK